MPDVERIYVLGAGAVGLPLAVYLVGQGRPVTVVRTSTDDVSRRTVEIAVRGVAGKVVKAPVTMVSLSKLKTLRGIVVITAKSYANMKIASALRERHVPSPVVLLQNGLGVERPFVDSGAQEIYRCVLYVTGQQEGPHQYSFRAIAPSLIGIVRGDEDGLRRVVEALDTGTFPFRAHKEIRREVWKKAIINSVFNSICPLLETDNGIFQRDRDCAELAREIVAECLQVTGRLKIELGESEIMEQIFLISRRSEGQLISTLQDIRNGRETEIDSLNLEISRAGENLMPPVSTSKTKLLGELVLLSSRLHKLSEQ